jgi:energy-coupling factor transporter transmembrane protein EcfT
MQFLEPYQVYAVFLVAIFLLTLVNSILPRENITTWLAVTRNFFCRNLVKRHALIGPWSIWGIFTHSLYVAANVVCLCFTWQHEASRHRLVLVSSVEEAASQAGYLTIVNLLPLFITPQLCTAADLLGVSLRIFTTVHRAAGMMSLCLCVFHATGKLAARSSFLLIGPPDINKLIVTCTSFLV